jgi:hypothetical protein
MADASTPSSSDLIGTPPGAAPRPGELLRALSEAYHAKGADYRPRTHHLRPDGVARYTNRLIAQTSPYLLQHAHNPVDWYPWGDEAFARAERETKPVLLSVGYSTCHWCHVMEAESFEDEEIAQALNEHYVCIKVDREERPDVDAVYMAAVQALTGGGGWPMNLWLTPGRAPFFGGTYFPPRDGQRGNRRGFLSIVRELGAIFRANPDHVAEQAAQLVEHVRANSDTGAPGEQALDERPLHLAARALLTRHDGEWGGFGGAPKFPRSVTLEFLLRAGRRTGDAACTRAVETTLDRMARGGMYDQIGGGFHRYSTDERWLVPHFEKMLYDNALLAVAYLEGAQATGRADFARIAREVLDYLRRELLSPEGGFYSATDADSLGAHGMQEGAYFVWAVAELERVLTPPQLQLVRRVWAVSEEGNFEGRCIPWLPRSLEELADELDYGPDGVARLLAELGPIRETLYGERAKRPPPLRDDKLVASWNGLALSAFARAALAWQDPALLSVALRAGEFILDKLVVGGRLHRTFMFGRARHVGTLEDYACVMAGLLDLFEASQELGWLDGAVGLERVVAEHFRDPRGGYFAIADDAEPLLFREKPDYDGALPSGNSVMVQCLLRLGELTGEARYVADAEAALRSLGALLAKSPWAAPRLLSALDYYLDSTLQVVLIPPDGEGGGAVDSIVAMLKAVGRRFVPNRVVLVAPLGPLRAEAETRLPLLRARRPLDGRVTAYVCRGRVCDSPTVDVEELSRQLSST